MLRNLYLTNQLRVDTIASKRSRRVVMFMVKVRLVDKNENSHVGRVKVTKVIIQIRMLGTMVNMPSSRPPSMLRLERAGGPASVEPVTEVMFRTALTTVLAADDEDKLAASVSIPSVPSMLHVG